MRILTDPKLDFDDVLLLPKRSTLTSRADVDITRSFTFKWTQKGWHGVPIFAANMDGVGTIEMAKSLSEFKVNTALHKHYSVDELVTAFTEPNPYLWYTLGISPVDLDKFNIVVKTLRDTTGQSHITKVCIDVANGYTENFVNFVAKFRDEHPDIAIMAGNVVTGDMTEELILRGADIVKVGIGPGSTCITRKVTGIGYPQLSSVIECADAAHGLGGLICSDGGCKVPGDVVKALAAGGDFVMLGGMLAGHKEGLPKQYRKRWKVVKDTIRENSFASAAGYLIKVKLDDGTFGVVDGSDADELKYAFATNTFENEWLVNKYKELWVEEEIAHDQKEVVFYGMSSYTAQDKHNGGRASHRASEGKEVKLPYRGPVADTIKEILGGVRSACTYVGARKLKELSKRTTFIMVNRQRNTVFDQYDATNGS